MLISQGQVFRGKADISGMDQIAEFYDSIPGIGILITIGALVIVGYFVICFLRAVADIRTIRDELSRIRFMTEVDFRQRHPEAGNSLGADSPPTSLPG